MWGVGFRGCTAWAGDTPQHAKSSRLGFGAWGFGFGVWSLGFGSWGLGFEVWGLRFLVLGCRFRVSFFFSWFGFWVLGARFQVDHTFGRIRSNGNRVRVPAHEDFGVRFGVSGFKDFGARSRVLGSVSDFGFLLGFGLRFQVNV